jgi:hypothetical protein|tara:strand:+ start:4566 stop:4754 length:189 start_codon:yes stop_codon:yes gene_type:complete
MMAKMSQNGSQAHNPTGGKANRQPFGGSASKSPNRFLGGSSAYGTMKSFANKTLGSKPPKYK